MLRIENFTKRYGDKVAVDNLTLHIAPGEVFGFIGHNGAGKTTTLKAVVGILGFDEGEILINGKSIKKEPIECKKLIAYIPDNPDLYDYMSGIKYLNFIADIFKVSAEDREARIKKYADAFELTPSLAEPISIRPIQRTTVMRATMFRPKRPVIPSSTDMTSISRKPNPPIKSFFLTRSPTVIITFHMQ